MGKEDERAAGGAYARFERLFRDHYAEILRYSARRIDADAAQDIATDTFLVAWRRLDEIVPTAERAWLFATARHLLANEYRSGERRERLFARLEVAAHIGRLTEPEFADLVADRDQVIRLLNQLPADGREALELLEWEGLTSAEAARVVGCTSTAMRVRAHRARKRLLELYRNEHLPAVRPQNGVAARSVL